MSSTLLASALVQRLQQEVDSRRAQFIHALTLLDPALAAELANQAADEWADHPKLQPWPALQQPLARLKQVDAALCQWQLGLYGLCSDCEVQLSEEQLYADPCMQRCGVCEQKHQHSKKSSWQL